MIKWDTLYMIKQTEKLISKGIELKRQTLFVCKKWKVSRSVKHFSRKL